jgi:transposase
MTAAAELTVESLQVQLLERDTKLAEQNAQILHLEEQLTWFKRQIFGRKSERIIDTKPEQLLFDGFESTSQQKAETKAIPAHERKKRTSTGKDTIKLPDDLPVETTIIDIPEEEKICRETGLPLQQIGEEVSHKLAHRPGSYYLKRTVRPKYVHPQQEEKGVITASMPDALLPKCRADESLLAEIITRKFVDHLPLYRIAEAFSRERIVISRRLLSQWVIGSGMALRPLYHAMKERILQSERLHIDESPVDIFDSPQVTKGYMWVLVGGEGADPPYRLYDFYENRKHEHAAKILDNYSGIIHSDKYGAYEMYIRKNGNIWCPCWAHIRRKFFEAEAGDAALRIWVLEQIGQLFSIEETAWTLSPNERLELRQSQAVPIIDALIERIKKRLTEGIILPRSKFKEALGYFCSLIPHLKNYTRYPSARLDNNPAERAIRPLAIGRKNWLFFGSIESGEAAATLLSLVQTCRALNINPRVYLEDVCRRIMGHSAQKLYELLPDEWFKTQAAYKETAPS